MKKIYSILSLGALLLAACAEDPLATQPAEPAKRVAELSVPADFDWKTMSEITCDFTALRPTRVAVALDEGAEPLALFFAGGEAVPLRLTIPHTAASLCVSYETASGSWKSVRVPVSDPLCFRVPADGDTGAGMTRGMSNEEGCIVYPAFGRGTLLFEDLWPGYGDYDFNDLVMNYDVRMPLDRCNQVSRIDVSLTVRAVGGSLPYDFYIGLAGVYAREVEAVELLECVNASGEVSVALVDSGSGASGPAIVEVKGFRSNANRPEGAVYLNTERGHEMAADDCVNLRFGIRLRKPFAAGYLTLDTFDFFIARTDEEGRRIEIHQPGYKPTAAALDQYQAICAGNANVGNAPKPYFSNDRLVWALNLPAVVPHAYEQVDFLDAYPRFREWVQSGGILAQDWYLRANAECIVKER